MEREARSVAEKALAQAEETIRQLRTRLAHAEMALAESAALAAIPVPASVEEPTSPVAPVVVAAVPATRGRPRKLTVPVPASVAGDGRFDPSEPEAEPDAEPVAETTDEPVEWWRPGWRERLRGNR